MAVIDVEVVMWAINIGRNKRRELDLSCSFPAGLRKGNSMGTPNRETQEYSKNIIGLYLQGSLNSEYPTTIFLGFPALSVSFFTRLYKFCLSSLPVDQVVITHGELPSSCSPANTNIFKLIPRSHTRVTTNNLFKQV